MNLGELKITIRQAIREIRRYTNGYPSSANTEIIILKLWKHYHDIEDEIKLLKGER